MNSADSRADSLFILRLVREGEEEWRDAAARLGCKLFDFGPASGERDMRENEVFAKELTYPKCIKEQEVRTAQICLRPI